MTKKILIINGPNLNMLGKREKDIYGNETLDDIKNKCLEKGSELGIEIDFYQSNLEGEIVNYIQKSIGNIDAIIINPAAYTHTSVAIRDALLVTNLPIIEVHISNTVSYTHLTLPTSPKV